MNIQTIAEHSVAMDLLAYNGYILDIGCRGFLFTDHLRNQGYKVFPIDCDDLGGEKAYYRYAIVGYIDGPVFVEKNSDAQATKVTRKKTSRFVMPHTLKSFSDMFGMYGKWDLIKMDIESTEYEVIMSLTEPPAKQLSIEFHLHTGAYKEKEVTEMVKKLMSLGYFAASHEKTSQHGCGLNYWDSLFILK